MPEEVAEMFTNQAKVLSAGIGEAVIKLDEVEKKLDLSHRLVRAMRVVLALLTVAALVIIVMAGTLIKLATDNRRLNRENHETLTIVRRVTNPKTNQEQTAKFIRQIVDTNNNGIPDSTEILKLLKGK